MSVLLTEAEAAELVGVKTTTLAHWRRTGKGHPPFYKLGGSARYDKDELIEWISAQRVA